MATNRKIPFLVILTLLGLLTFFAYSYNQSVTPILSDTLKNARDSLRKDTYAVISQLQETDDTSQWLDILDSYPEILLVIEDEEGNVIEKSDSKIATAFDIEVQSAFEYKEKTYLIKTSAYFFDNYTMNSRLLTNVLAVEILIVVAFLAILVSTVYVIMLRPYRKIYRLIEEYDKTGKLRPYKFRGYIGQVYNRFGIMTQNLDRERQNQSRIIASISHDIKTPLTSIMGYSERLMKDNIPAERTQRYLETIYNKSIQIRGLVDEFDEYLDYNMHHSFDTEKLSTGELCCAITEEYADELEHNGVSFEVVNECPDLYIELDMTKMKRVFGNIISNSMKHFKKDVAKKIRVEVREHEDKIIITFGDSGVGVEEDKLNMIFEPLYTSDEGRKVAGLGLAISKEIIENHSGTISAGRSELGGLEIRMEMKRY